jgi:redox-sensitive bicupin YhaK (pirin superfamily)
VQLWVALPQGERFRNADFAHHADLPVVEIGAVRATVMVGEFAGAASPAETFSPLVGAQVDLTGLATLPLQPDFEYAVLAVDADLTVDGQAVPRGALQYLGWGATHVQLAADPGARVLVLGGEPMTEDLLMWWNFVGRTHEEIVEARRDWEAGDDRFGPVPGDPNPRLSAPALPTVALKARPARR